MTQQSRRHGRSAIMLFLASFLALPSFLYVALELTSLSAPLALICCGLLVFMLLWKSPAYPKTSVRIGHIPTRFMIALLALHVAIDIVIGPSFEAIATFLTLTIFGLTAYLVVPKLVELQPRAILSSVFLFLSILIASLIVSLFVKTSTLNYDNFPISVFPFAEPSHFAVFTAPLFLAAAFVIRRAGAILMAVMLFVASAAMPNLTLGLIGLTILSIAVLRGIRRDLFLISFVAASLSMVYFFDEVVGLLPEYHQNRAGLSIDNLTSLVYLQGYERAYSATVETLGYGAGFMRLGDAPPGYYGSRILEIMGSNKNLGDGAFVFAKLVAEFGILGLLLSLLFAWYAFVALLNVLSASSRFSRTQWSKNCSAEEQMFFYKFLSSVLIFSYSFEFFVRGIGYLSSGSFLLLVGIFLRLWLQRAEALEALKGRTSRLNNGQKFRQEA